MSARTATSRILIRLALAMATPLLFGLYAYRLDWSWVPYVALVPWLVLYTDDRRPGVSFLYYVPAVWSTWFFLFPVSRDFGWTFPVIGGLAFQLPWLLFVPLLKRIHHRLRWPRAVVVPIVWVAVEWVRTEFTLAHFDVHQLGYSQAGFPALVQIAEITGVYGISFLVAAVNGFLADVWFTARDRRGQLVEALRRPRLVASLAMVVSIFGCFWIYGHFRMQAIELDEGPRIAIVQPNVRHRERSPMGVHLKQVVMTAREIGPGEADLIVWPENAVLEDLARDERYVEDIGWLAREKDAWFLVGALSSAIDRPGFTRNSAVLIDRTGDVAGKYDKIVLFPWSEHVPLDRTLGILSTRLQRLHRSLVRAGWGQLPNGTRGTGMNLLRIPWKDGDLPFAVLICSENSYPPLPAEAGRMGARFLLNITSEGEIGGPVQGQLLRVCILRAVENRISYVRVGNTGISGFIDPVGRLRSVVVGEGGATIDEEGFLIERVALSRGGGTIYARSRGAFALLCVLGALYLLVRSFRRRRGAAPALAFLLALVAIRCGGPPAPGTDVEKAPGALEAGRAHLEANRAGEAIVELAAACAKPGTCREAMPLAAQAFLAARRLEDGADFFASVAERHPEVESEARGYRGYLLERSFQVLEAEAEYRASLVASPSPRVYALLGNLLLRNGRPEEAIGIYEEGVRVSAGAASARYLLGRALPATGRLEEAERELLAVLLEDREHELAWVSLGRTYLSRGNEDGAISAFRRAIQLNPRNLEARFMLARMAIRAGDLERADRWLAEIQSIEEAAERRPTSSR